MKILIITENVGGTAPGIVFERLIKGISKIHDVDVLTSDFDPSIEKFEINNLITINRQKVHPRIHKFLISIFGISPLDWIWSKKSIFHVRDQKYDLVISLISFHHYSALLLGNIFTKQFKVRFMVYSVDANPAPLGWSKDNLYFRMVKKMMAKYLPQADYFFSANEQMLAYQLKTFKGKETLVTGVLFNPNFGKLIKYDFKNRNYCFLYTGGIYGVRKVEYVINGFRKFLASYPNSSLEFVGSSIPKDVLDVLSKEERAKIIFHPFTKNLKPFYERSTALLDIDADLENDVFLSSKIINYIAVNRIIISETGPNSPSRKLFKGIPSIIQCDHNEDAIAEAMKRAINLYQDVDFYDRSKVLSLFDLNSIVSNLNRIILN